MFLGGDFIEIGVRSDGAFGAEPPASFFGTDRGEIGLYADIDGFYTDARQLRYDYFLPGTPEERWSVGYNGTETASNGQDVGDPESIGTEITDVSTAERAAVEVSSQYDETVAIHQEYSFEPDQRFFRTDVTLTNTGPAPITDVRYQRSHDPDNGVDLGCSYITNNTVRSQQPTDGEALVAAQVQDDDACRDESFDEDIPIFYFSEDDQVRVSTGKSGLSPTPVVYGDRDYTDPQPAGTSVTADTYIALTFAQSTLEPGESASFTFYTALTDDIETTLEDIDAERSPASSTATITISNSTISDNGGAGITVGTEADE